MRLPRILLIAVAMLAAACNDNGRPSPSNLPPTASISAECGPTACSFTTEGADPDGTVDSYSWDFGDGSPPVTTRNAAHTYAEAGRFTVTLTVTDNDGESVTASYEVVMTQPPPPPGVEVLAFGRNGDLYVVYDDGTGLRRLTSGGEFDSDGAWSPDGARLAFTSTRDDGLPTSETSIDVVNWDGTERSRLSAGGVGTHDGGPSWSPDGTRIAFHRKVAREDGEDGGDPYYQDRIDIYAMHADGTEPVQLTHHRSLSFGAAWSPDGSRIAYTSWDFERFEWTIRAMNADGTNDVRVTAGNGRPAWSPDGSRLVFSGYECTEDPCPYGPSYLFTVNLDGTSRERVTTGTVYQEFGPLAVTPDGSLIAFTRGAHCGSENCFPSSISVLRVADGSVSELPGTVGASVGAWRPVGGER